MKSIALALLAFAILMTLPAFSQSLYDNGPINGTTDAWTINFGFAVSDSFTLAGQSQVNSLSFGAWVFPGDVLQSAEVLIGSSEFSGDFFDGVVNFTQTNCLANQFGFNVCTEFGSFNGPALNAGTYWLTLENATVNTGDPIYWDENSGPSSASESSVGTIPSEAFTLDPGGCGVGNLRCTTTTTTSPEPSSLVLLISGAIASFGLFGRSNRS